MKGKIVQQCGVFFIHITNKRVKDSHAFISNQDYARDLYETHLDYDKLYEYIPIVIERYSKGYYNTHVVHHGGKTCNLIGTNGSVDETAPLYSADYIPSVVMLLEEPKSVTFNIESIVNVQKVFKICVKTS